MPVLLKGVGSMARIAGPASWRPAAARGALYSVVDTRVTCYGYVDTSNAWCVVVCDVL